MSEEPFREMQPKEWQLIRKLLEPVFPGRDELSQQLETAKVRTIDEDGCAPKRERIAEGHEARHR
jgi:hypothetical protein